MTKRRRSRVVEQEVTTQKQTPGAQGTDALYGVAMLKIALELKREPGTSFEEILGRVVSSMHLDELEMRAHLAKNGGLLRSISPKRR